MKLLSRPALNFNFGPKKIIVILVKFLLLFTALNLVFRVLNLVSRVDSEHIVVLQVSSFLNNKCSE
jgi:hypothetical protein